MGIQTEGNSRRTGHSLQSREGLRGVSNDCINPYLTNGFSHNYQLDESTFIFRDFRCDFKIIRQIGHCMGVTS